MRRLNNLYVLLLLAIPVVTSAKTADAEQPIQIEADQVEPGRARKFHAGGCTMNHATGSKVAHLLLKV